MSSDTVRKVKFRFLQLSYLAMAAPGGSAIASVEKPRTARDRHAKRVRAAMNRLRPYRSWLDQLGGVSRGLYSARDGKATKRSTQ
jgi:hypothetical protein